jgi:aminoglycoside phosphotransferase (APT) family kinase protein
MIYTKATIPDIHLVHHEVARLFPQTPLFTIERINEGVSTYVYRVHINSEIFYLRLLPEIGASFAPEALIHQLLRDKGVRVPEVVYFEHRNEALQLSLMLTTEIKGTHVGHCTSLEDQKTILRQAGKDLAIINSTPVQGFGWIKRDSNEVVQLKAEFPTYRAWIYEYLEDDLNLLANKQLLNSSDVANITTILARYDSWLDEDHAYLAHGDFDATHIYQQHGQYTGIIDFGEIRGATSWYDLGHFQLHDGETLPNTALPYLLEGYQDVVLLPLDYEQRVSFANLLIALRTLAYVMRKYPDRTLNHGVASVQRAIQMLLA